MNRPQDVGVNSDRVKRLHRWLDEHEDWIRRQQKAKIVIHISGKVVEVEIGYGKEKI